MNMALVVGIAGSYEVWGVFMKDYPCRAQAPV